MTADAAHVSRAEADRRTIRRTDLVPCAQAFIDCRTPGSDRKGNYALIGSGVSQSSQQVINLREPHGYNIGAADMPNGVTNNLHLHYTAEVFLCFRGEWLMRWGVDGKQGELLVREGDVLTVPTWIFRGFTNVGPDDGWLFTALGHDDTGGIIWGPSVLAEAAGHGLYLDKDHRLLDTVAGDSVEGVELIEPMPQEEIDKLRAYSVEEIRGRLTRDEDLRWSAEPFLDARLPGGGAELGAVIGFGMTEDRDQEPRVVNPHSFNLAWLRAGTGRGMLRHRHSETQVLIVKDGTWEVTLNEGDEPVTVHLEEWDTFSVPRGAWRSVQHVGEGTGRMAVVNGGDGRVRLDWAEDVVQAAEKTGLAHDHNGYVADPALLPPKR